MRSIAEIVLDDKHLGERWARVTEDFWGDLKRETEITVKRLLETSMEVQVQDLIGSNRWERNLGRSTYRNGYYHRKNILTSYGNILGLSIPRIREGTIEFKALGKYQRRAKDVDQLILGMFLNGVSTRQVKEVLAPMLGLGAVSAGTVSKITKTLDKQVGRFHRRRYTDKYEYLILDGIYLNAKSPLYKKRRCILVAYGIWTEENKIRRELIEYRVATKGESEHAWWCFLNDLVRRGFEGKRLKLVVMDGNEGLHNAVDMIYPDAEPQLCWAHKLRNIANKVPRRFQTVCMGKAKDIYEADSYSDALKAYKQWRNMWKLIVPEAVKCLDKDIERLLNFYQCPKNLWKKLRTTNAIERSFREVRRRTRPMSCFQNVASVERIIYAIFARFNKKWNNGFEYLGDSLVSEITHTC